MIYLGALLGLQYEMTDRKVKFLFGKVVSSSALMLEVRLWKLYPF
jgi:hypothetical protein